MFVIILLSPGEKREKSHFKDQSFTIWIFITNP